MPTGPVNDAGAYLYFEDSGAPAGSSDYVTLFLVHGTMFHSAVFRPMIPFAGASNLRLVLVNLRDYPGSSPYSEEDIALLSNPETQPLAVETRGAELAYFIAWFVKENSIPQVDAAARDQVQLEEGRAGGGGFALLGWSSGNCQTIPVVAHADKFPRETRELFGRHFRTYFFYDSSLTGIGGEAPADWYSIFRDGEKSYEEKVALFPLWVSMYHAPIALAPETPEYLAVLKERLRPLEDEQWRPSILRVGPERFSQIADPAVMVRSQVYIQRVATAVYQANLRRALALARLPGEQAEVWPALRMVDLYCDMSLGEELLAAARIRAASQELGSEARPFESVRVEGANHFVHWDSPEMFTRLLASKV